MRAVVIVLGLVAIFIGGAFVEYRFDWPIGWVGTFLASAPPTASAPAGPSLATTAVPRYSSARGAEDAPRNDTPQGAAIDLQRCINTMVLRRESEKEARTVCQKIIAGIGG